MVLSFYTRRAIKWFVVSLLLYAATVAVREVAWAEMLAGGGFALAFFVLFILGILATIALASAIFFALMALA